MSKMNLEFLSVNATSREVSDYIERFEIWAITQDNLAELKKAAYFLNEIGKDSYALVKNMVYPDIPIKMPLAKIQEAFIQNVQPIAFEAAERSIFKLSCENPTKTSEILYFYFRPRQQNATLKLN